VKTIHASRRVLAAGAAAVLAASLAACGSDDGGSSATTGSGSASSKAAPGITVPDAIKSKGTLTVASDATYAPMEFTAPNGKDIQGVDPDLAKALGDKLGLTLQVKNATFDAIIPGLAAKKYDLGMSSFTDTKEREQTVDFVTYFTAGTSFFTKADGGTDVTGLADLCGKTVAVEKGTTQADDAQKQSKDCTSGGKGGVKVQTYPDQNGANLALSSGRAQIGMADSPVADYQVKKSGGQFKLTGTPYGTAPYGIAVQKDSGLAQPLLEAVKAIQKDGTYTKILDKWGVSESAIDNPTINGAQS
jgi:polar amino acid transport system substrate-binding protein